MQMIDVILPAVTSLALCGVGMLVFRWWSKRDDAPPVWFVFAVWVAALAVYLLMTRYLWVRADQGVAKLLAFGEPGAIDERYGAEHRAVDTRAFPILLYCLFLWVFPVLYYTYRFRISFEARNVEPRTWTSMDISDGQTYPDATALDTARSLAMMGDVNGAVEKYRSTVTKRVQALFSAAKLLEADGRYEEAAELLQEVSSQSQDDLNAWSKALFSLARLTENCFHEKAEAISLLNQIVVRAPDSEHGKLASKQLARLQPDSDALLDVLDAAFEEPEVPPVGSDKAMTYENPAEGEKGADSAQA